MKRINSLILALLCGLILPAHSYTNQETFKVGDFMTSANGTGIAWLTKQDGTNFLGCTLTESIMWQASSLPGNDPNPVPFTPTQTGLESTMASVLMAKGMNVNVTVYYHVDVSGYCRYELIVVRS